MPVKKAGAVILSHQNPESVLLLYQTHHKDWSFPKGHVDEGESIEQAMYREVLEETGLNVELLRSLTMMPYNNSKDGDIELEMFLVQSVDDATLKKEYEGNDFLWMNYRDAEEKLSYENLKKWHRENLDVIEEGIVSHIASSRL